MRTSLFLFSEHKVQACSCGRVLGGSYVELEDDPPGSARERMHALRGALWSHEVNGPIVAMFPDAAQDVDEVRATHQRIPGNPPDADACFCGGLGQPYSFVERR